MPFFSYFTFARAKAAFADISGVDVEDGMDDSVPEAIVIAPGWNPWVPNHQHAETSYEGPVTGDRLTNDQVLHLIGTLIGIKGLCIGEETADVVVSQNAVASQKFAA